MSYKIDSPVRAILIFACFSFALVVSATISVNLFENKPLAEVRKARDTTTIYSNATYDGYAYSVSSSNLPDPNPDDTGDGNASTSLVMYVGEYSFWRWGAANNFRNRSFLAFPLDAIPSDATVLSAILHINLTNNTATLEDVGNCIIDHIGNYTPLDNSDYQIASLTQNIATLATPSTLPDWITVPGLESYVQNDLQNSRSYTHFRLRQSNSEDSITQAAPGADVFRLYNFTTGDSSTPPYLEIIYSRPPDPPINLGVQGFAETTSEILNITDHTPDLNWTFSDPDIDDTQQAYNVSVVRISDSLLMWFDNSSSSATTVTYGVGGGMAALELVDGTDYYFRVKTQDNHGLWGDWAEVQFHMNALPITTLAAPANDTWVNDNTPLFEWDYFDAEGSAQYAFNLTISANSDFSSIDYFANITSSDTFYEWSSALPDGIWYWRVKTSDSYEWGDWSEYYIIKIDSTLPTSTIENPLVDPAYYDTTPISLDGTCSDALSGINRTEVKIVWKDNNTVYLDWTNTNLATNYTWWNYEFAPPNEANFTVYIRAVDNASNYQVAITRNVTYDITEPSASIVELPTYSNSDFLVSWSGSDALSGIKYYTVQSGPTPTDLKDWLVETLATSAIWQIDNTTEGAAVYFKVIVYDKADNSETTGTATIRDTIKPISYILAPEEKFATNITPIKIEGNCSDEKSGISAVEINITYKESGIVVVPWTNTNLANNYSWWDYSFNLPEEANYTVKVRAVDKANNKQAERMINITYDITPPPAPTVLAPTGTIYNNTPALDWTSVADTLSGLAYYKVWVLNETYEIVFQVQVTTNETQIEDSLNDGNYSWYVRAYDRACNWNESFKVNFTVDTGAPPILRFYINYEGAEYTNNTTVTLFIFSPAIYMNISEVGGGCTGWTETQESLIWNLTQGEGLKKILLTCANKIDGNYSIRAASIILDETPPLINYNYPTAGNTTSWYNSDPGNVIDVDFRWIAHSPLDYAQYKIGAGDWIDIFTSNLSSDYTSDWLINWSALAEGDNQISLRVADCAGNVLEHVYAHGIKGFLYRKDAKAPPAPVLSFPQNNTTILYNEITFSWETVEDQLPGSGVAKYEIEVYDVDFKLIDRYDILTNSTIKNLTDGTYYWRIRAIDHANNFGVWSATFKFAIDTLGPRNIIFLINGGAKETSSEEVYLIIYAENTDKIKLWNSAGAEPANWVNYITFLNWTLSPVPNNTAEYRTVQLKCLNIASNKFAELSASILVNKTPPFVKIIEHERFINTTNFTLYWEPLIELGHIKKFEVREEDKDSWIDVEKNNVSFTFYNLAQGYHFFYVRAVDINNICGAPNSTFICVDLLPPTNLNLLINNGAVYTNSTYSNLELNASEDISVIREVAGIDKFYISNNGILWIEYNYSQFPITLPWNLNQNGDGNKTVWFKVKDRAGNSAVINVTIFLDREKPTNLHLSMLERTNSTSIKLTLFAFDPGHPVSGSGIYKICFSEDGINWGVWVDGDWVADEWINYSQSYTYKLQPGNTQDGTKTIYFKVKDRAENENYTASYIILDRSPKLRSPTNNAIISSNITLLIWENNTPDPGIYSYLIEYDINNTFPNPIRFVVNNTTFQVSQLLHNTTYYWRVKMVRNGDESFWSQVWNFTIKFPDLSIVTKDISFYPANIVVLGELVIINVTIHNLGDSDAENILVEFYKYDPRYGGILLGSRTIDIIKKGSAGNASIGYSFAKVEEFGIFVWIDPYNSISEIREDNNLEYNILKVVSFPDAVPVSISLSVETILEPVYIFEEDNLTIVVEIKNRGGDIVKPFKVEFFIVGFENGLTTEALIAIKIVESIRGEERETVSISANWTAIQGNYRIKIVLNTTGIYKEHVDNNELTRDIVVYYKTALRLTAIENLIITDPETEISYIIIIENIGLIEDTYELTVENISQNWDYDIIYQNESIKSITLQPGENITIYLVIKVGKGPFEDNIFYIVASSRKDPRAVYEVELVTRVIAPPPPFPWYLVIIGIIAAIILCVSPLVILKVIKKAVKIDEIFLLYRDGRLIKHFTRRLRPYRDEDILASMLTAVKDFVKDVFKGEPGMLEEMKFGDLRFMISSGKYIVIAAVFVGKRGVEFLMKEIKKTIEELERKYEKVLIDWDGDLGKVISLTRDVEKLLS